MKQAQSSPSSNQFIQTLPERWKILSVEDDQQYQDTINFVLEDLTCMDKPVELLNANSRASAADLLSRHQDISVILLDVVMEEDDSGLRLVDTIRNTLGNQMTRIILLTGQPGVVPEKKVMQQYDIDEYWCKTDIDTQLLERIVTANIRTWHHLKLLDYASRGLQLILSATRHLQSITNLNEFANQTLNHINQLIDSEHGGVICATTGSRETLKIIASSGTYREPQKLNQTLANEETQHLIEQATRQKNHILSVPFNVLFFSSSIEGQSDYLCIVSCDHPLTEHQIYLLRVFSENVSTNFTNISLLNRLGELAYRDRLLSIGNRNWLLRHMNEMTKSEWLEHNVVMFSLEDYASLQLSFGKEFTELCVRALLESLRNLLPGIHALARIHQHYITAIFPEKLGSEHLYQLTQKPLMVKGTSHRFTIRGAMVPMSSFTGEAADMVLGAALHTLELARQKHEMMTIYNVEAKQQSQQKIRLLSQLREALEAHQVKPYLQPKICLKTNCIVGFEALARWHSDEGKMIPPDIFIPLAEEAGLIAELDIAIYEACLDFLRHVRSLGIHSPIAINFSAKDFENEHLPAQLLSLLYQYNVPAELIELEVTESISLSHDSQVSDSLHHLINEGFTIAIDDFGTGYSSLSQLNQLPAQQLKIDRSFVSELGVSDNAFDVIEMILRLSQRFSLKVVAEGIETTSQQQLLKKMGCDIGQGYLFAKPMPMDEVVDWYQQYQANRHEK